ncbi:MAG: phosphatidylserine decarboxylase [Acidiphilium sp.]|nr:phosphatidylserine decarboxylase [Acidiphilium sp.]MDD4935257.1 phosphatidylserine decarboxylase [Acidiphilium sp.]
MDIIDSVRSALAPPHRAGFPFIAAGFVVLVLGLIFAGWLAWLGLVFALFCLYFFRDPDRVAPPRADAVLAPADGLVVLVDHATPPAELGLAMVAMPRIAIFLSVLDVHVNRIPMAGIVTRIAYRHGNFVNAAAKESEQNERNAIAIRLESGAEIAVVQIAGLIARRILCDVHEGDRVATGARFGMIRFGSRTDVYLPLGTVPLVAVGQRAVGGETVLADLVPSLANVAMPLAV